MNLDAVLCYVDAPWAYFTTQKLEDQWGDDWNDAPYEHNAGLPYEPSWRDLEQGRLWEIVRIAFAGEFDSPDSEMPNSRYSVEMINDGATPWLKPSDYASHEISILAGTPLKAFIAAIELGGGTVYLPNARKEASK